MYLSIPNSFLAQVLYVEDILNEKRIIQGTQSMTLFKDSRKAARKTIDVAIKLGNREALLTNSWTL